MSKREVSFWYTITKEDFDSYVEKFGDRNPVHVDPIFAQALFGKKVCKNSIAHGALINSYASPEAWRYYGDGTIVEGIQEINLRVPVEVGEQVGFVIEELETISTLIGGRWPFSRLLIRLTVFKKAGDRSLRIGSMKMNVSVPTKHTLGRLRRSVSMTKHWIRKRELKLTTTVGN